MCWQILLLPSKSFCSITISGVIYGANEKPVEFANLTVVDADDGSLSEDAISYSPVKKINTEKDGIFQFQLETPGNYRLIILPLNHEITSIPLPLQNDNDEIKMKIFLAPIGYLDLLTEFNIYGNWNNFQFTASEKMKKQANGTFIFEKEYTSDTLSYIITIPIELMYLTFPRSNNLNVSSNAGFYSINNYGALTSQIISRDRHFKIIFDPSKIIQHRKEQLPKVIIENNHQDLGRIINLYLEYHRKLIDLSKKYWDHKTKYDEEIDYKNELVSYYKYMEDIFLEENEPLIVRQSAAVYRLLSFMSHSDADVDSIMIPNILEILPFNSNFWSFLPEGVSAITRSYKNINMKKQLLRNFEEQNPVKKVRAIALASLTHMAQYYNEKDKLIELYNELKSKYGDVKEIEFELKISKPDISSDLCVGIILPEFKLKLLNVDKVITNNDLIGKYYLIDFWSTWCSGCVASIKYLQNLYEKYKDKNFTILSVSFDNKEKTINKFQEEKYRMPWINAFVGRENHQKIYKDFEILSLPKAFLVDPDGKIVAGSDELMGENIVKTVDRILK